MSSEVRRLMLGAIRSRMPSERDAHPVGPVVQLVLELVERLLEQKRVEQDVQLGSSVQGAKDAAPRSQVAAQRTRRTTEPYQQCDHGSSAEVLRRRRGSDRARVALA